MRDAFHLQLVIVSVLILMVDKTSDQPEKLLQVAIYYEVHTPNSINFITGDLNDTLSSVQDILYQMELKLIPYGKTKNYYDKETAKYHFRCNDDNNNGEDQCKTYKAHACALNIIGVIEPFRKNVNPMTFEFIVCLLKNNITFCLTIQKFIIFQDEFHKCFNTEEASRYLVNYGTDTDSIKPPIQKFPAIVFDGNYSVENSDEAFKNFEEKLNSLSNFKKSPNDTEPINYWHWFSLIIVCSLALITGITTLYCIYRRKCSFCTKTGDYDAVRNRDGVDSEDYELDQIATQCRSGSDGGSDGRAVRAGGSSGRWDMTPQIEEHAKQKQLLSNKINKELEAQVW